ncbi:ATP-dependent Clp protease proteolytic subunit [Brachybacterium huguangmaarense]|uniref:ATP-dependent Clp protease proteolytic subunit n=1 Tax=Brachybacterium huguangmaarense TaxID=1652028 RepID=A0ABY6FXW9_9MICO|nr:head maturation protease, ClpP-related [Brachybacterium huguangmaarense]UYG15772.1 ATP-dependent Clp protease proteolytic subunit [Brachybacterium huguangmaarense]
MTDTRMPPRARSREWFRMDADEDQRVAQVYLYDAIDPWWGVSAKDFARAWNELDVDHVDLFINSPGGDVFDALAILNVIRRSDAKVVAHVDGIAASAASFIAMGADEVVMGRNSELMIHDASGLCWGRAEDMQKMADDLGRISGNIASIYAEKTGGTVDEWRTAMLAETWYSADEAVTAGLADRVDRDRDEAEVKNRIDLSIFNHAGRADAPAPALHEHHRAAAVLAVGAHRPPAEPADPTHTQKEGPDIMPDIKKGLIDRLGISDAEVTDEDILAAVDEALAERAEAQPTNAEFAPPAGTVLMDADQLDELRSQAAQGVEARNQQVADRRAQIVDSAINDGRVAPARREHWLAQLTADEEGAAAVLNTLAPGTIPLAAKGFTGGVNEATDEDLYNRAWPQTEKEA